MGPSEREGSGEEDESMDPSEREGAGVEYESKVAKEDEAAATVVACTEEELAAEVAKEDEAAATNVASTADELAARNKMDGKVMTRTSPNSIILAVQILSSDARKEIIRLGFEQLLFVSLDAFRIREILRFLMNNTRQSSDGVEIKIGTTSLPVTLNVVAHVLGVPEGSDESLVFAQKQEEQTQIKQTVRVMLKLPADPEDGCEIMEDPCVEDKEKQKRKNMAIEGRIKVDYLYDVMREAKEAKDVNLEVKCFFFVAFHTLLIPATDGYLTVHQMQAGMDLERIGRVNWRKVVLEQLRKGVKSWLESKAANISGPVTVLLLYYLDNLKSDKIESDASVTPRICYYDQFMLAKLVEETKQNDCKLFDKLKFRSREETCYSRNYNECDKVKVQKVAGVQNKKVKRNMNRRTRLGKNEGGERDKEEKGMHVNPVVKRRKEVVKIDGGKAEKNSGGKNDMFLHIPSLEDLVKSSLKDMPRYLHNDAIKTVKLNHSSTVEMYGKILETQSQMFSLLEGLLDRYKDLDKFYSEKILSKADWEKERFGRKVAVSLHSILIPEHLFVQSMKPKGWLSNFIVDMQCCIWREKEEWKDKIILSQAAVNQLLGIGKITGKVENELANLENKKQIFVPVLGRDTNGHGVHWSLLVVDIDKGKKYILDSLPSKDTRSEMQSVISALGNYFAMGKLIDFSSFRAEKPTLKGQSNGYDCGFYMLMYMEGFDRMKIDDIDENDVNMYRKKLVKDLCENPDNNPQDLSDEVIASDLASSPPRRDQPAKKRSRSAKVSGTAPPAKRQRQQTEDSIPQKRVIRNTFATTKERKTQMDMQAKEGTRVNDLVCSKDSKFKEQTLLCIKRTLFTGSELAESFSKGACIKENIMDAFIACKNFDSAASSSASKIIYLSTRASANFNDEARATLANQLKNAAKKIGQINMIFLPIVRGQHCYMHCFNFANKRADYLSCTASLIHENVAKKDCEALMEEMYKVEKLAYKTTKNTRLYCIKHNFELADSDNLLFAMYFMESYSGKEFSEIQNLELWSNYKAFILQYLLHHSINNVQLPEELLKVFEIPATKTSKGLKGKSHAQKELFEKMKFGSQEKITKGSSVPTKWSTEIPSEKTMPVMSHLKKFIDDHKDNGGTTFMLRDDDIWEFSSCPKISFSANDIVKSFDASKLCEDAVLLFFSKCLMDDYESFKSERIILDPFITSSLLGEKIAGMGPFDAAKMLEYLKSRYKPQQFEKASHIYLPVNFGGHWTLYVVNLINKQIDILDSSSSSNKDKQKFHKSICQLIQSSFHEMLNKFTNGSITNFSEYGFVLVPVPTQMMSSNDCGFFVMMFLERYDPDTRIVHYNTENSDILRAKVLHYLMFHKINKAKRPFPEVIEQLRIGAEDKTL